MDFLSMSFRYTQIRLYSVLHGVHLVLGCTTRTFLQRLHNLSRPALVFCSALSASLPCGAAFCFGVHAEACDSECGCRPHSTFIIWFCRAFRDFSCFVGKVVPFVLIRRGLLFSAIVRRMSPADLGDPGETGRARLTWAAWIPWEIKILHQKWLWIGGMTIWMDGCIAGWIMRTNISPRFILPQTKVAKVVMAATIVTIHGDDDNEYVEFLPTLLPTKCQPAKVHRKKERRLLYPGGPTKCQSAKVD